MPQYKFEHHHTTQTLINPEMHIQMIGLLNKNKNKK
jgi:hypothetical protein